MAVTAPVLPRLAQPPWYCDPNGVKCRHGHMLKLNRSGYSGDLRRLVGHAFFECKLCTTPTWFLAIFCREPSPLVLCYAITHEAYAAWTKTDELTPPTAELLYTLRDPNDRSYNPTWRPAS
jgi:hypothetical protein